MSTFEVMRATKAVSTPTIRRRGFVIAALALLERLLPPSAAYALMLRETVSALVIAAFASALVALRGTAKRSFAIRNESELYRSGVTAVLAGDVLEPTLLPDHEARLTLFHAMNRVSVFFAEAAPEVAANVMAALLLGAFLSWIEPGGVLLAASLATAGTGGAAFAARRRVESAQMHAWSSWERLANEVTDACEARFELAAMGREPTFIESFAITTRAWETRARRAARFSGMLGRVPMLAMAAAVGSVVAVQASSAGVSWSKAWLNAALLASCAPTFFGLARGLQELISNVPRLQLIADVLRAQVRPLPMTTQHIASPRCVEWREVSFAYPSHHSSQILRSVSFEWRRGELLALAGPNGSGKSTCLRAGLGLAPLAHGAVLIDGVPLSDANQHAWRRSVSFLPQRPYLPVRGSVGECLRFFEPGLLQETLYQSLSHVGLLDALRTLADDPLSVAVGRLSTGQRHRLALARVLGSGAPALMLDEPDANLDSAGIVLIRDRIVELARERMVVIVAHSADLLGVADRVVTLADGVVCHSHRRGMVDIEADVRPA